jgi:hypothetical protein
VRLAKRIAGWLQDDPPVRQLRLVGETVCANFVFFTVVSFQPGVGNAEIKVPELQPVLDKNIRNPLKRIGVKNQTSEGKK